MKELAQNLVDVLERADHEYYNNSNSLFTDAEYDVLRDELNSLDPNNDYFKIVGSPVGSTSWEKATHKIAMGSLNKVNTVEEFEAWCKQTGATNFTVGEKLEDRKSVV